MAPSKRQTWVDVYDPDTGHYKPQLVIKGQPSNRSSGQSSGETSGTKSRGKTQEETTDYSVQYPQGNAHKLPESSGVNNSSSDESAAGNGTNGPNDSTSKKLIPRSVARIEPSPPSPPKFKGLSQSRWAPKDTKATTSIQQPAAGAGPHQTKHDSDTAPKQRNNSSKPIDTPVVHEVPKTIPVATTVDVVEKDAQRPEPTTMPTNTEQDTVPKDDIQPRPKVSCLPPRAEKYVKNWVQESPEIVVDLHPEGVENPERCDVDPETGRLMDPVVPAFENEHLVGKNSKETDDNAEAQTQHSEIYVELDTKREYRIEEDAPRKLLEVPLVYHERVSNPREIRVPCHLRPAKRDDMTLIAALYNEEMHRSYKTIDKRQVAFDKWINIYDSCCTENLPFFVAVDGWHNKAAKNNGPVIAFAVMDVAARGIFGSYKTNAAPCGKLTVVVHPDWRRMNVCSALLDAVFSCCSTSYSSREGYEFVNERNDRRYMIPKLNSRQWHFIDIETVIPSGPSKMATEKNERFKWMASYLSEYFNMKVVYHDEKLYRDDRYEDLWLDKITFRHQCRPLGS
ncbi:hypothetical protein K445DRAFT_7367 [Daldinia sp. EC12]|nr:hypothetical protein K445DRAFT_7367 [Daldinia sp. EC12]